jgi:hypothetical protein
VGRLAMAVAIVVALSAGCGGDSGDTAGSPPAESTTVAQGTPSVATTTTTGGGDGGGTGGGRQRNRPKHPRTAVEAFLASGDAADRCGRLVTKRFLFQAYSGPHACAQAPPLADGIDFKSIRVEDNRATAVVVPSGGPYDGERVTVSLVRDGRRWVVDELNANVPVGP